MTSIIPIEHKSQRVLTTQQLAERYETDTDNISRNYGRNSERYIHSVHYFILDGDELRQFKASGQIDGLPANINRIFLWTEKGALLHAKSLNTDRAWEVYQVLVDTYFRAKELSVDVTKLSPELQMFNQMFHAMAKNQLMIEETKSMVLETKTGIEKAKEVIENIKDTMAGLSKDQWRKWVNGSLNEIVKSQNCDYNHEGIRNHSYDLLEERAGANLGERVRRAKARLEDKGATKTAVENYRKLDAVEEDKRLKEIYTGIIRELRIKYLV